MQGMFWAQGRARILGMALATEISREGMAGIKIGKTRVAADVYFFQVCVCVCVCFVLVCVCACICTSCVCLYVSVCMFKFMQVSLFVNVIFCRAAPFCVVVNFYHLNRQFFNVTFIQILYNTYKS